MSSDSGSRLPNRKSSDAVTCTVASDPTSLQGRAMVHHVSYSSRSYLPSGEGSGALRVPRLRILPPYQEDSGVATACHTVSCGLRDQSIKKSLAGLFVQLGLHVPNAHAHVFKAPEVNVIMGL
jgi:hypothetical protein